MTTALEVLRYINEKYSPLGEVQYQKLLYYAQAWSLAWDGKPLFDDTVEAWKMGPVVPSVRRCARVQGPYELTPVQRATIDAVVQHYGQWSGAQLIEKTHSESPWLEARGDLPDTAVSRVEISHDSMRREYTQQSIRGEGPQRPPAERRVARRDDVLALADGASREWSRTLALLAE